MEFYRVGFRQFFWLMSRGLLGHLEQEERHRQLEEQEELVVSRRRLVLEEQEELVVLEERVVLHLQLVVQEERHRQLVVLEQEERVV